MKHLDRLKKWHNSVVNEMILVLDEKGYTDRQIMDTLEITKQTIYNTKKIYAPLTEAIRHIDASNLPVSRSSSDLAVHDNALVTNDKRDPDVQVIVDTFKESFGTTSVSKYDRFAANRLAKKYGSDAICKVIIFISQHQGEPYTPVIGSVAELDKKLVSVQAWFKRQREEGAIEL